MRIRPFSGMLLASPIPQSEVTKGGIFIPDNARSELKSQYKVVQAGKGRIVRLKNGKALRLTAEVATGDTIIANSYAGKEVTVDGRPMKLLHQDSVMAVVSSESQDHSN